MRLKPLSKKAKIVVFDGDLKAEIKKYPISVSGDRIKVRKGGEAHFMPSFDKNSFLDMPYRSLSSPWKISYERTYFARKLSKKCVNFETEILEGPDPETVLELAGTKMLRNLGKEEEKTPIIQWVILLLLLFIVLNQMGVIA